VAVALAVALLTASPALAAPAAAAPADPAPAPTALSWDYPEFSTAQWVTTGLFVGLIIAMEVIPPQETKLSRGLWGDDQVRDALVIRDLDDQRMARSASDVMLTLMVAYPYLVDSLVLAYWHRRSPAVAKQMALISAQTMAITIGLTSIAKVAVSRERPYGETCGQERSDTNFDCQDDRRYRSFFSGHNSLAFASAGLICMHHLNLKLYGSLAADAGACAAAYGVAAVTGTLRIVADQHYFTDVIVGAAVGTLAGLGIPYVLHYRHGKAGRARGGSDGGVEARVVPTANGVAITGTFGGARGGQEPARTDTLGLDDAPARASTWADGPVRPFVATRLDLGFLYFKPRVSFGYGRPHHVWAGLDLNPLVSGNHGGVWAGARGTLGWIDLRVGGRYQYAWYHSLLEPRARYTRDQMQDREGPNASYFSLEAELTLDLPLGPGNLSGEVAGTYVLGVKDGYFVYEDTIKVVVDPPWVWRARLGWVHRLDRRGALRLGAVAEVAGVPRRDVVTVRGGLMGSVRVMPSIEARILFMPVWYSHDSLGSAGSDLLLVGLRHRWATGVPFLP